LRLFAEAVGGVAVVKWDGRLCDRSRLMMVIARVGYEFVGTVGHLDTLQRRGSGRKAGRGIAGSSQREGERVESGHCARHHDG
jgi:hypothetical protein